MQRLTTLFLLAGITFTVQAQTDCGLPHDINNNGSVDIEDFLSILGLFGDQDSDGDGVYDSQDNCIDLAACNFATDPSEPCEYLDAVGVCGGGCLSDPDDDGICDEGLCGGLWNYQGYNYSTVLIGEQCWFAENLRSENYENGDVILSNLSDSEWGNTSSGAVAVYNLETFGRLYNWFAVNDARGLCPSGWHVPSDSEWAALTNHLGGESVAGVQMKTTYGWDVINGTPGSGTNSSGFSGLPGGWRHSEGGHWDWQGWRGTFWSSSSDGSSTWIRGLIADNGEVSRYQMNPQMGLSVRCIQD